MQRCRSFAVRRKEGLQRQLGQCDVEWSSEDSRRADERKVPNLRRDAQGHDDLRWLDHRGRDWLWLRVCRELLSEVTQNDIGSRDVLVMQALEQVSAPLRQVQDAACQTRGVEAEA